MGKNPALWMLSNTVVNPNPKSPKTELIFLPYLSEIGPPKTCPIENPIRNIDKDNSIFSILTSNAFAISGIDGRYVSTPIGATEDKIESKIIKYI